MKTDKNWEEISIRVMKRLLSTNPAPLYLLAIFSTARKRAIAQVRNPPALLSARFHFRAIFGEAGFRRLLV